MPTPFLDINELYTLQNKRNTKRKVAFDRILELIHKRIRNLSTHGAMNTFYEIPGLLYGYPLYDIRECTDYVIETLRKNGFLVQILPPPNFCVIYISWKPEDTKIKNSKPKNPISNPPASMTPLRLF